jgi:protein-export membrane protein SecD
VQRQGEDRIVIQLPGLLDKQRALDLIGQTAQLEFKLVKQAAESKSVVDRLDRVLAQRLGVSADTAFADTTGETGTRPLVELLYSYPNVDSHGGFAILRSDGPKVENLLRGLPVDSLLPGEVTVALSTKEEQLEGGQYGRVLYVLTRRPQMTGAGISTAVMKFGLDANRPDAPGVSMTMNSKGTTQFRRVTGDNVGRQLAIVLDDRVVSAPVIRDRIPSGQAQITGSFSTEEANDLAIVLRAGALPAPIIVAEERTVGPSLGRDSIQTSLNAGLLGAIMVVLLMVVYYRASGLLAILAVLFNTLLTFAALAAVHATLTLPGIAGIILSFGMAVDSNVLIFERIREELRFGKRVRMAVEAGYHRAWRAIIDSHVTTLISAAVLFQFGTGPIKGFAVTLVIGVLANLYTAVLGTKLVYDAVLSRGDLRSLSI